MTSIYSTYFSQFEFNNQNIIHQNSLQTDPQNPIPFSSMNSSFVQSVKLVTPYFSHYASDYPVLVQRIPESPVTRFWNSMSGPTISTHPRSRKVCLLLWDKSLEITIRVVCQTRHKYETKSSWETDESVCSIGLYEFQVN